MTIEQQYRELKKSKHLWPLMPKGKYLQLVLQAQALLDQMERELRCLESVPTPRMPARPPSCPSSERKAKGREVPRSAASVDPGAFTEARRRAS